MATSIDAALEQISRGLLLLVELILAAQHPWDDVRQAGIFEQIDSLLTGQIEPAVAEFSKLHGGNSVEWLTERAFAQYLHSSVQGALYAAQAKLGLASPSEIAHEIRAIEQGLRSATYQAPIASFDFLGSVAKYISLWDGVLPITLGIDEAAQERLASHSYAAQAALEIVKEAINNSVKHGKPSRIDIRVFCGATGKLTLEIISNGTKLKGFRKPGFGSLIFEALTDEWVLSRVDGGVRLWCELSQARAT